MVAHCFLAGAYTGTVKRAIAPGFATITRTRQAETAKASVYLSLSTLAHILERHYCINAIGAGRFVIPIAHLVAYFYLRNAYAYTPEPIPRNAHLQRMIQTTRTIGFTANGDATSQITIITDTGGGIVTAFPGRL